jgi:hypothetical protein
MLGSKTCFVLLNVAWRRELAITGYSIIHDGKKLASIPLKSPRDFCSC